MQVFLRDLNVYEQPADDCTAGGERVRWKVKKHIFSTTVFKYNFEIIVVFPCYATSYLSSTTLQKEILCYMCLTDIIASYFSYKNFTNEHMMSF